MKSRANDSVLSKVIGVKPQTKPFVKAKRAVGARALEKIAKVEVVKPSRARLSNDQLNDLTRLMWKLLFITWFASMSLGLFIGWSIGSAPTYTAYENGVRSGLQQQDKATFIPTTP